MNRSAMEVYLLLKILRRNGANNIKDLEHAFDIYERIVSEVKKNDIELNPFSDTQNLQSRLATRDDLKRAVQREPSQEKRLYHFRTD